MAVKEAAHARYSRSVIVNQAPINVIAGSDRLGSARLGSARPGPARSPYLHGLICTNVKLKICGIAKEGREGEKNDG